MGSAKEGSGEGGYSRQRDSDVQRHRCRGYLVMGAAGGWQSWGTFG